MVVNFEIVPGEYEDLPDVLLAIPGFKESPEFQLVAENTDLPGVIVGALRRYVERLEGEAGRGTLDANSEASLEGAYDTFERMAASGDPAVENALVVEVFEHLDGGEGVKRRIVERLGPRSSALYERWSK